ncbi:MAG: PstS family phosphate ABC transporter substrate-binding protein [Bacteroidia bacterium]|nr:PstS family phosphate ABC transporter substrate-binding protein [Bacteroidia bacterium]MCO5253494.1 PstS family phosphate ABC transporter substrate-binding protein [Bacteroidota bacterium]MCZ2130195.1 PstS family phosphate ABC transporter substrate-binding protein [Bacteroidia bacterium]
MKKLVLTTLTYALLTSSSFAQKIKGSDTVLPLTQKALEAYKKERPAASLSITGGGSGVGISALLNGTTDIAQSSRRIKFDERQKFAEAGKQLKEVIIAYDALSIVVHPENKVTKLTREQLEGIFTGKIKNWKEVGGEDLKIIPYSRETSSGTYEFFKESVLKNKNYMNGILSMPATGGIIQSVSQTKGAISYVGFAYVNSKVKAVQVSYDKGKTYIAPTFENAKNKSYPIVRPLFYYYTQINAEGKSFIDFVLSPKGQKVVADVGYLPIK